MTFEATGVRVMLSAPGDAGAEIEAAQDAITKWNAAHAVPQKCFFVGEHYRDAVPVYTREADGQAVINEQITSHADVVVCIFKHRLGTPTARNEHSGTVEEAELRAGAARVHMYFWAGDTLPLSIVNSPAAMGQWARLNEFKALCGTENRGLYGEFSSPTGVAEKINAALWNYVQNSLPKELPAHAAAAASPVSLDLQVDGQIWQFAALEQLVEFYIDSDVKEEEKRAAVTRVEAAHLPAAFGPTSATRRKPKTGEQIEEWKKSTRGRLPVFDAQVASAAPSMAIKVISSARLEKLQIEVVVENVRVAERSNKGWGDVWQPLHQMPPKLSDQFGIRGMGNLASFRSETSAEQRGDHALVEVELDEIRKPQTKVPTYPLEDVLMVPWDSQARTVRYTWTASAANSDQEWSGEGEIVVRTHESALDEFKPWLETNP